MTTRILSGISFRTKLTAMVMALILLSVLLTTGILYWQARQIMKERIFSDLAAFVETKEQQIMSTLNHDFDLVDLVASRRIPREHLAKIISGEKNLEEAGINTQKTLRDAKISAPDIDKIDVLDLDGRIIGSTDSHDIGTDLSGSEVFINGRNARYFSGFYRTDGRYLFDVSQPLGNPYEEKDGSVGVLVVRIKADNIYDMFKDYREHVAGGEMLLGKISGNDILFLTRINDIPGSAFKYSVPLDSKLAEPMRLALKKGNGIVEGLDPQGRKVLGAYRYIPLGEWGLVTNILASEAFRPIDRFFKSALVSALIVLLISSFAVFLFTKYVMSPIKDLQKGTERISAGDLDYRLPVKSGDEIGLLAQSFNDMAQSLKKITASKEELDKEITIRKDVEMALIAAKKTAEDASRLKSEFLANMSHEIRTPMNGVMGMAELLMQTQLSKDQKEYVQAVQSSAESLMAIINDILDLSKIEAQKIELESVAFNFRDTMGDMLNLLGLKASEKNLELAYHIPPEVPDSLEGDPVRLRQIIINLVGNAIKFTEKGEIVVSVKSESLAKDCAVLLFTVADTGIGIPAEKQKLIFDPFSQADASTTRRYGGTGLGLTISSKLIGMMGGRVWIESEPGRGTKFHFTLRLGLQKNPAIRQAPEKLENLVGLRILVVDDNSTNRRILEEMLKNWKMRPSMADSAETALKMMSEASGRGEPYKMLLLDANMPVMDGFELVEKMKQTPGLDSVTLMMLTSSDRPGDSARCRKLGIAAYLIKPIKQSSLLDSITTVLGKIEQHAHVDINHGALKPETKHRKLQILLVEDNSVNQMIATAILRKQGHSVVVAENGAKAIACLDDQDGKAFDLVLMDLQMPVMDGFEATRIIREKEKAGRTHIPIIALTANAMKEDRDICLNAGMDGYAAKPLKASELFAAMAEIGVLKMENGSG